MGEAIEVLRRLSRLPKSTEQQAYEAGRDCAVNGANTTNCHFSHFATPETTGAWERGKRDAEAGPAART